MKRAWLLLVMFGFACQGDATPDDPNLQWVGGKADDFRAQRIWDVRLLDPHCDVCTSADKDFLLETSPIIGKVVEMIESAQTSVDVAQFTFSRREIEAALLAAHERGVAVRLAMNHQQSQGDNVSTRLKEAGVDVQFVQGKNNGSYFGLQHAKFMVVDETQLLFGSNNWSSTGTSFNEENTVVLTSDREDPILASFRCAFNAMYEANIDQVGTCHSDEAKFTPSTTPWKMIRDEIRASESTIDLLMHHLVFKDSVKELAKAAERGVRVRIVVNAADRDEISGTNFDRLFAAGGQVRFKQTNQEAYQIMHHKLAIIDGKTLLNGSGNWSGSAFFNNYEFFTRLTETEVVEPFRALFTRLWNWSLTAESLDNQTSAALQDMATRQVYFGNLHAHYAHSEEDHLFDDGKLERTRGEETIDVSAELEGRNGAQYALEYARDVGGLDFMALSPHTMDSRPEDGATVPNMDAVGYAEMLETVDAVNTESAGRFVGLRGFEWSTNSTGNHINVLGAAELSKVERGKFVDFYEGYLPSRTEVGERPIMMLNHPRTFRSEGNDTLNGSWDQIYGVNLLEITSNSDRTKKFNDYGIDDYSPLRDVRDSWITGGELPNEQVVAETLMNIADVTRPFARLMEVTVNRGADLGSDVPQNPSMTQDPDTMELSRYTKVHSDWDYHLLNGFRVAPVSSHDNHFANWGTGHTSRTAIHASELTEAALMDAMHERAVFASEDENLDVRFYAEGRTRAGEVMRTISDNVVIEFWLEDPDFDGPFEVSIWLGKVGGTIERISHWGEAEEEVLLSYTVPLEDIGEYFVYLEVLEAGPDRMAWSAPIWIVKER